MVIVMGAMSISHWLIVLFVVLILFGPKKLGNLGKSLGEGVRGLREGLDGKEANEAMTPSKSAAKPLSPENESERA